MNWYMVALRKYVDFNGRARRTEYWVFALVNCIISIVLWSIIYLPTVLHGRGENGTYPLLGSCLFLLFCLATFLPGLAVAIRRLHDTGKSGWWFLITFVPLVGSIILLIFLFMDSQPGPNQYGPNPKGFDGLDGSIAATPRF
jgi:uncharacterized membrane protein YhaH (DUF805 family)